MKAFMKAFAATAGVVVALGAAAVVSDLLARRRPV